MVSKEKERLYVFDFIRAIAVLLVLLGHFLYHHYDYESVSPSWVKLHPLGVGMFFFISGYLIFLTLTKSNAVNFLPQRYFRLAPALLVAIIVLSTVNYFFPSIITCVFSIKLLLQGLFFNGDFFQNMNVFGIDMWTLHTETRFYLLAYLVYFFVIRQKIDDKKALLLGYIVSVGVILMTLVYLNPKYPGVHFSDPKWNILCILYLYFGAFLFLLHKKTINAVHCAFIWIINAGLILLAKIFIFGVSWNYAIKDNYLIGCTVCIGLIAAEAWIPRLRSVSLIAFISYPLYLIHHPLIAHGGLVAIISIFVIAYLISEYIEHPMMRWAKQRF
jgi:peptidoglycan/LPS O-acetylase OafA/YrhL